MSDSITGIKVQILGNDGNAFAILGKVQKVMIDNGVSSKIIYEYVDEATSGDYNHLLKTTMKYVDIE